MVVPWQVKEKKKIIKVLVTDKAYPSKTMESNRQVNTSSEIKVNTSSEIEQLRAKALQTQHKACRLL